jgi:hypothetical protein
MDVFRLHIVGMNNTLFLVLVSDLMLVACIWGAFLLDRLTERRRSEAFRRLVEIGLRAKK